MFQEFLFIPFPNDKILDLTRFKAFADEKLNIAKMKISLFDRVENTVGKGENAGYQIDSRKRRWEEEWKICRVHFLFFSNNTFNNFLNSLPNDKI